MLNTRGRLLCLKGQLCSNSNTLYYTEYTRPQIVLERAVVLELVAMLNYTERSITLGAT